MNKTAFITGAAGQDGKLLTDLLLGRGYRVIAIVRPGTSVDPRFEWSGVHFIPIDLCNIAEMRRLLSLYSPDEVYHFAAAHHSTQENSSKTSLSARREMVQTNFTSTDILAFSILEEEIPCHLVFAASSQMYTAKCDCHVIDEDTPKQPSTFYGRTKLWSWELLSALRAEFGLIASVAILFNHESNHRAPQYVTRKITMAAAAAKRRKPVQLDLMNIGARADWSSALDVANACHLMATAQEPRDYVLASGVLHSVRDLLDVAFGHVGLDWREFATFRFDKQDYALCGNPQRAEHFLNWKRTRSLTDVIREMVDADLELIR